MTTLLLYTEMSLCLWGNLKQTKYCLATRPNACAGSSLIGTCLFILVISILSTAGLGLHYYYDWQKRHNNTAAAIETIQNALTTYREKYGTLPCPAPMEAAIDSNTFGLSLPNCNGTEAATGRITPFNLNGAVSIGTIPVRSLNLPDLLMVDGWNHRFQYAVTTYYTVGTPAFDEAHGAISLVDRGDNPATAKPGDVVYILMSMGYDSRGAFPLEGMSPLDPCEAGSLAEENCDDDATFRQSALKDWDMGSDSFTSTLIYAAGILGDSE